MKPFQRLSPAELGELSDEQHEEYKRHEAEALAGKRFMVFKLHLSLPEAKRMAGLLGDHADVLSDTDEEHESAFMLRQCAKSIEEQIPNVSPEPLLKRVSSTLEQFLDGVGVEDREQLQALINEVREAQKAKV